MKRLHCTMIDGPPSISMRTPRGPFPTRCPFGICTEKLRLTWIVEKNDGHCVFLRSECSQVGGALADLWLSF